MSDWQPIATAPKDGTSVLLFIDSIVIEARWKDHGKWSNWETASLDSHGCGCCGSSDPPPTHWMPLPAAPY